MKQLVRQTKFFLCERALQPQRLAVGCKSKVILASCGNMLYSFKCSVINLTDLPVVL